MFYYIEFQIDKLGIGLYEKPQCLGFTPSLANGSQCNKLNYQACAPCPLLMVGKMRKG